MIFHCFEYNVNPCCLSIIYLSVCFLSICLFVFLYICLVVCLSIGWFIQLCIVVFFFCLVCFIYVINCSQLCPELQIKQILPYPFLSSGLDISELCPLQKFPVFTYLMFTSLFTFCLESWYCLEIFQCAPLPAGSYLDSPLSVAVYMKIISIIVIICYLMR